VKNPAAAAKKLSGLLKKIGSHTAPPNIPHPDDPIAVLVMSFLMWESSTEKAIAAYARIFEHVVDFNDLRVCLPHETLEFIGPRYPRALDRCQRMRAVLKNIYIREHAVTLKSLNESGKRDVKKYIESLEGIVPYVSARSMLLSFDTHAVPVDDQLRTQLIDAEVSDAAVEIPELSSWLASQVKSGDGPAVHYALQSWIDGMGGAAGAASSPVAEKKSASARGSGSKKSESKRAGRGTAKSATG
jgi:hypothetical protein